MRNGQTAAIGPPKASSYLASGGGIATARRCCGGRAGYLVDRTTLLNRDSMESNHLHYTLSNLQILFIIVHIEETHI